MADIYSRMNRIMDSMHTVYAYLKKHCFVAGKDMEFELALPRIRAFFNLNDNEAAVFTYLFMVYFSNGEQPVCGTDLSNDASTTPIRFLEFREEFLTLEDRGLIVTVTAKNEASNATFYRIPDRVVDAVVKNDEKLLANILGSKDYDLTYPSEIKEKTLFYTESLKSEVGALSSYLEKNSFSAIQDRLSEKEMPKGVCIMLYGDPGTGKTETVYQIARSTNRPIYQVDIGDTISMWHGGTVKNLEQVFKKYNAYCEKALQRNAEIPILLFNEADSLFGKRVEKAVQGAEIDENHVQSYLLDYLEQQKGIVMCTTNLQGNFDKAFERCFLFKIKFEKPDVDITKKIWKNKVSWLNRQSVEHLASSYALSGAEIDNVVRKATMNEVLTGKRSSVRELEGFCKTEKLHQGDAGKIGFNV